MRCNSPPDLVERLQEGLIVVDKAQLAVRSLVLLQRPVRRRRDYEVHALGFEELHAARVCVVERVGSWDATDSALDCGYAFRIFGDGGKSLLVVA